MREVNWTRAGAFLRLWQAIVAITASVMTGGVIWIWGNNLPPQIPLFYSMPWGEEQLVPPWGMVWTVISIWMVYGLSLVVSKTVKDKVLGTFVAGAGMLSEIVMVLGLIRVVLIIT
jgi:hypothetical protein